MKKLVNKIYEHIMKEYKKTSLKITVESYEEDIKPEDIFVHPENIEEVGHPIKYLGKYIHNFIIKS
jgi:hypothetical protein